MSSWLFMCGRSEDRGCNARPGTCVTSAVGEFDLCASQCFDVRTHPALARALAGTPRAGVATHLGSARHGGCVPVAAAAVTVQNRDLKA